MKPLLYLLLLCFVNALCFAQNNTARIKEIKNMYKEITGLVEKNGTTQCKSGAKTEYESFDDESEKMPFEQTAEYCKASNIYSIYKGNFSGYEWGSEYKFYLHKDKIFFVFISSGAEACADEHRIYYSSKGGVIKILLKSNDCTGGELTTSAEITDKIEKKKISDDVDAQFDIILKMLNATDKLQSK